MLRLVVSHSLTAFYGTIAKAGTAAHFALAEMCREKSGELQIEGVPAATVLMCGNSWSGEYAFTIQVGAGTGLATHGGYQRPLRVPDGASPDAVVAAIGALGLDPQDFEPPGHFIEMSVF